MPLRTAAAAPILLGAAALAGSAQQARDTVPGQANGSAIIAAVIVAGDTARLGYVTASYGEKWPGSGVAGRRIFPADKQHLELETLAALPLRISHAT